MSLDQQTSQNIKLAKMYIGPAFSISVATAVGFILILLVLFAWVKWDLNRRASRMESAETVDAAKTGRESEGGGKEVGPYF